MPSKCNKFGILILKQEETLLFSQQVKMERLRGRFPKLRVMGRGTLLMMVKKLATNLLCMAGLKESSNFLLKTYATDLHSA
jgi:hypothetical protein